jgi:hypothetical protein
MPSGYTADISKGISFKQFALICARAFGISINTKNNTPIPEEIEPYDYHLQELKEAERNLAKFKSNSEKTHRINYQKFVEVENERYKEIVKERKDLEAKYRAVLNEAQNWQTPTPDHDNFKEFMIEQIENSIDWDCKIPEKNTIPTFEEWKKDRLESLEWDVDYHRRGWDEEQQKAKKVAEWTKALIKSL